MSPDNYAEKFQPDLLTVEEFVAENPELLKLETYEAVFDIFSSEQRLLTEAKSYSISVENLKTFYLEKIRSRELQFVKLILEKLSSVESTLNSTPEKVVWLFDIDRTLAVLERNIKGEEQTVMRPSAGSIIKLLHERGYVCGILSTRSESEVKYDLQQGALSVIKQYINERYTLSASKVTSEKERLASLEFLRKGGMSAEDGLSGHAEVKVPILLRCMHPNLLDKIKGRKPIIPIPVDDSEYPRYSGGVYLDRDAVFDPYGHIDIPNSIPLG